MFVIRSGFLPTLTTLRTRSSRFNLLSDYLLLFLTSLLSCSEQVLSVTVSLCASYCIIPPTCLDSYLREYDWDGGKLASATAPLNTDSRSSRFKHQHSLRSDRFALQSQGICVHSVCCNGCGNSVRSTHTEGALTQNENSIQGGAFDIRRRYTFTFDFTLDETGRKKES